MGSCFKNIFNRKKETYYFVNPYSPQEGKYQTKDEVKYDLPTNSDVIRDTKIKTTKVETRRIEESRIEDGRAESRGIEDRRIEDTAARQKIEATPAPPHDHDVVDFMESSNDVRDDPHEVRDEIKDEVTKPESINQTRKVEDINDNSILTKHDDFYDEVVEVTHEEAHRTSHEEVHRTSHEEVHTPSHDEVHRTSHDEVHLQVNDEPWHEDEVQPNQHTEETHNLQEDHHSSEDDIRAEEDLTAAIAEVVEEAKAISSESLHEYELGTDDSKRSSRQEEVIREDVMAVEAHPNEAASTDSVNITVVQADYTHSPRRDSSSSRSSTHSRRSNEDITEAPQAFQDSRDNEEDTRVTETVEELRETGEDGGVTVITVTTTEITRTSEFEPNDEDDDDDDDTREPTVALLNKNTAQIRAQDEDDDDKMDRDHTTTSVMVNSEGVDDLPRELNDLDTPPSPTSVVHINTPFPVDQ